MMGGINMEYSFKIYEEVYNEMINGQKTIEIRLLNDKTESIKAGDIIRFNVLNSDKFLLVKVTNKIVFRDIDELWSAKEILLDSSIYSTKEEFSNLLNKIFGEEKVKDSKIVGIEFEII